MPQSTRMKADQNVTHLSYRKPPSTITSCKSYTAQTKKKLYFLVNEVLCWLWKINFILLHTTECCYIKYIFFWHVWKIFSTQMPINSPVITGAHCMLYSVHQKLVWPLQIFAWEPLLLNALAFSFIQWEHFVQ
jgi:hypothetical protein